MRSLKVFLTLIALVCAPAWAAPFLVCNPSTDADVDIVAWQEGTVITRSPTVAGACHADLVAITPGTHSITVWFESTLWGTQSAAVPFSFSKPSSGGVGPTGIGIRKN